MTRALLAGGMLVLVALSGCSDQTDQYCGTLEDDAQKLTDLRKQVSEPGSDPVGEGLSLLENFRSNAPDDVVDEWDTVVFAWQGLADAIEEAGVDPGDYEPGKLPAGVGAAEAKAIQGAALELASPRVTDAGEGIEQHTRDVCKIDLDL